MRRIALAAGVAAAVSTVGLATVPAASASPAASSAALAAKVRTYVAEAKCYFRDNNGYNTTRWAKARIYTRGKPSGTNLVQITKWEYAFKKTNGNLSNSVAEAWTAVKHDGYWGPNASMGFTRGAKEDNNYHQGHFVDRGSAFVGWNRAGAHGALFRLYRDKTPRFCVAIIDPKNLKPA
jgi:hypothetical protein